MNYKKLISLILAGILLFSTCGSRVYAVENVYEVQKGDSLWGIAEKFLGDGARYTDIVAWNEELVQDASLIYPGTKLRIMEDVDIEYASAGPYQKGTISGGRWESTWLGLSFELPEYYEFIDVEELYDDAGKDTLIVLPEDSERHIEWEHIVVDPTLVFSDAYAFLIVEQTECSVDEYMEEIRTEIEKEAADGPGVNMNWIEEGTEELGSQPFESYRAEVEYETTSLKQHYFIRKIDDRIVLYCTSVETLTFNFPEAPKF